MICATRALGITCQNLLVRNVCGIHVHFCASYTQEGINEKVPNYTVKKLGAIVRKHSLIL